MTRTAPHHTLRRSLSLSTALGVTLGVCATPAAAQITLPAVPTVTPFGTVTPNGISGEPGGQAPVIASTNNLVAPNTLNVSLRARSTVLDWVSFNVRQNDTANFINATASTPTAVVLNRITGATASTLAGNINGLNSAISNALANPTRGVEVWIANPNGIMMGANGNFNTQGFVATTLTFGSGDVTSFLNNASTQITAPNNSTTGITGAAGTIRTNGRVLGFIAPVVRLTGGTFDTRSTVAGTPAGDVAFVAATDITIGNPASPLSMTITQGTRLGSGTGAALSVGGTVTANNAYLVVSAQNGVNALLSVPGDVTTASSVNGVVVLGGSSGGPAVGPIAIAANNGNGGTVRVATSGLLQANGGGGVSVLGNEQLTVGGTARTVGGGAMLVNGYTAASTATVTGAVDSSGAYTVTGGSVTLGRANATVLQQAVGNVQVTATAATGTVASAGALTLAADRAGTGASGLAITGPNGIALGGSTLVSGDPTGVANSTVTLTTTTRANTLTLGNVRAGTLRQGGAAGVASAGLNRTAPIVTGALTLSAANTLTTTGTLMTGAVTTGAGTTTFNGNGVTVGGALGNIAGQSGGVTIVGGVGGASLQGSNLAGDLSVTAGGVIFTDLAGTGAKTIISQAGIIGGTIDGPGAVTLSTPVGGAITVSGGLGTSATQRLGALTVDGGSFTLGNNNSAGVIGYLTSASIGQGVAGDTLTARAGIDHSGAFTATTTGATALNTVNSGGAFSVTTTTGTGAVSFTKLDGVGSRAITSAAGISGTALAGTGTVALRAAASGAIAITGGLGTSATQRLGALTVDGGSSLTLGNAGSSGTIGFLTSASLGQGTAIGALTARGGLDHSGAFTSTTTGATALGAVTSDGDLSLTTVAGSVGFTDLSGVGNKLIISGTGITGATITGAGVVNLSAAASGAIAITGRLGESPTQRLGALTVNGGSGFTLGDNASAGVIAYLTSASFGQTVAGGSLTARAGIDHSGVFTSSTTGATTLAEVTSGGAFSVRTDNGPVGFTRLNGIGDKLIRSGAGITGTIIEGPGTVKLSAAPGGTVAITGALGTSDVERLGALTVDGGSFTLGSAGATGTTAYLTDASFGQATPLALLRTFGAVDHAGAFTATAGTVAMGDVVSGGALRVTGGVGGASFEDLTGPATKTITADGAIGIGSIGGGGAVTLSVGVVGAPITVAGDIGATAAPVDALTIDGGNVSLNGFTVAGATSLGQSTPLTGLVVTGAADTGSLVADATGAMQWGSLRARTGDIDIASSGGGLSFNSTVDGPGALIVRAAPTAVVVFNGAVGGLSPFTTFISGGGPVLLNGGSLVTVGTQRFDGGLLLGAETVLTGGGATFAGGVNGTTGGTAHSLALNFTGSQALAGGDFVGIRDLATDTIGAAAGGTTLSGVFGVSGSLLFNDDVLLTGATELRSTGAVGDGNAHAVAFRGALDGAASLLVATPGTLTFAGDVGAGTALTAIDAGGANRVELQGASVTTTGSQAYGVTALNGSLTSGVTVNAGGDVSFAGLEGPRGLTVNSAGVTALAGGTTPLAFITTDAGGSTSLTGAIATTGTQTYQDAVTLAGDTVLTGALAVFGAGVTGNGRDLTIATSGAQELGNVVGVNNLAAQVAGGVLRLTGSIETSGNQSYGAAGLIVSRDLTLKAGAGSVIDIAGPVNGDGPRALTLTAGLTRLRGDVGTVAGGQLASLTVNGGVELLGAAGQRISTTGMQSYGGLVQLRSSATLIGQGASFGGGVDGDGQVFNDLTLTFAGASTLPANPFSNIGTLRIDGAGVTTLSGDITTRNGQVYDSALVLAGPVTLASDNAGAISLKGVTGARALTVNTAGTTSFDRALSGLASISTDAAGVTLLNAGLSATGAVDLRDNVVLGADLTVASTGGGALSFGSTITGPFALRVDTSGLASFGGAVGATQPGGMPDAALSPTALTSSGTGAIAINGGAITTSGAQRYAGQVRLGADAVLTGTVGTFGNGIVGNGHDLALLFANGLSVAGSITGVNDFTRGGGGTTAMGGTIDTIGGQTYLNNVTLLGDTVLKSGGGTGTGAINFVGTVDGAQALTVTTGGLTTFGGAVGGTTALTSVTVDGTGGVAFNGGGVATTGGQLYHGAATLGVDTRLSTQGGDITLAGPVDGARLLSLSAGSGAVTLGGRLGQGTALTGLAIRANAATVGVGGNRVGTLAVQLNTGPFSYADAGSLSVGTVDGVVGVTTRGATALTAGGLLTLNAQVSTGALTLTGTGVVSDAGAIVTARGPITIDANDGEIALGDRLVTTDDSASAVRLMDANNVRIGAIATGMGGTVTLGLAGSDNLAGNLTQAAGAAITAGRVVGSVGGSAMLTNANDVGTLGAFSANGFALRQANGLSVSGPVDAGAGGLTLQVDAGALVLRGDVVTRGAAMLIGGGAINQVGGGITAASLSGSAVGGVSLTSATNAVPVLAGFTNTGGGGIAFSDSVALAVTADLADGAGLMLSAPGLDFSGRTLSAMGDVGLDARGGTLTGGAIIAGGTLSANGGAVSLASATAGRGLALSATAGGVTVSGAVNASGDAAATATGAITLGSFGSAATPIGGAAVLSAGRGVSADVVNARGPVTVTAGGAIGIGSLSGGSLKATGRSIELGTVKAGSTLALTATAGTLKVTGAASADGDAAATASGDVTLGSFGTAAIPIGGATTVTSGGTVSATSIAASGPTTVTASGALGVGTLAGGSVKASGQSLDLGTVIAASTVGLSATEGALKVSGAVSAGGGAFATASGDVTLGSFGTAAAPIGGAATVTSGGALTAGSIGASGAATVTAAGALGVGTLVGDSVKATGRSVNVGTAAAGSTLGLGATGGTLMLGAGTAGDAASLDATGALTIATSLTSGGTATVTTGSTATVAAITSTGAGVSISGAGVTVDTAKAASALTLDAKNGALTLSNGNAGTATLTSTETLTSGALTTAGAATLTATGRATLGQSMIGAALTVTANGIAAGQTNAGALTMTSSGALGVTGAQVGADAKFDANGLATLGTVTAGSAGTITIRALDAEITGTQRAGIVSFVNRAPATVAVKLGDGTSAGGFALSSAEVNNVEAGQLAIDGGSGSIEIGTLSLDAEAGRSRVDVMTTGRIDVVGAASGGGAGRTVRFGGSTTRGDDKASVIRVVATPTGGGRLLFDTADLELRGSRIGVGQATGFLDTLGFGGGTGAAVGTVAATFVGNPNSTLYNAAIGGTPYASAASTLVSARSLTVRYTDYALFQNTAVPGLTTGVALSAGTPGTRSLIIQGPGGATPNAFALFGTIGAISGSGTALLGPLVIPTTGVNLGATRINGCLVGSGAGCLTAVVVQPLLSVLDVSSTDVFRAADDLAVPFDPVVGTSNEALFAGLGQVDDGVAATTCSADTTSPGCGQREELVK